jgi:hypothetical protein
VIHRLALEDAHGEHDESINGHKTKNAVYHPLLTFRFHNAQTKSPNRQFHKASNDKAIFFISARER